MNERRLGTKMSTGITPAHMKSIFGIIQTTPLVDVAKSYGVLLEDLQLISQPQLWGLAGDKIRITTTLQAMVYGSLEIMGIPRIEVPAEYIAGWICAIVAPINRMSACAMFDRPRPAEALATGEEGVEGITGSQLFALVHQAEHYDPEQTDMIHDHIAEQMGRTLANTAG